MNLILNLLITLIFIGCSRPSNQTKLDPTKTYISIEKSGNAASGPCDSCLIVEVNEYSIFAILSPANPIVETCDDSARYISNSSNPLIFPAQDGGQVVWSLTKTAGGSDPNCFPSTLEIFVNRDSSTQYNFLFSYNTNEYTMVRQQ